MIVPTNTKIDLEASQLDEMADVPAAAFEYLNGINLDGNTVIDGDEIEIAGGEEAVLARLNEFGLGTEQSLASEDTFTIVQVPQECPSDMTMITPRNYLTAALEDFKRLFCLDNQPFTNAQFSKYLDSPTGFRKQTKFSSDGTKKDINALGYDKAKNIIEDFCEKNPDNCGPNGKNRPKSDIDRLEEGAHPEYLYEPLPLSGNAFENSTDENGNMILRGGSWRTEEEVKLHQKLQKEMK